MAYSFHVVEPRGDAVAGVDTVLKPYLRLVVEGPMRTEDMRASMHEALELVASRSLEVILVDIRAATTELELGGFFFLAEEAARQPGPRPRTALVAREDQRRDAEYMEDSFVNRGLPLRVFFDMAESLRWLGVTAEAGAGLGAPSAPEEPAADQHADADADGQRPVDAARDGIVESRRDDHADEPRDGLERRLEAVARVGRDRRR